MRASARTRSGPFPLTSFVDLTHTSPPLQTNTGDSPSATPWAGQAICPDCATGLRAEEGTHEADRYFAQGVELTASESPEEFTKFVHMQYERYAKVIREVGIKPE